MAFCAGTILGASVSYLYLEGYNQAAAIREPRPEHNRDGESKSERFLSWLEERLKLDEDQKKEIWDILVQSRDQHRAIDEAARKDYSKVREDTRQKILSVLRPDQVEEFNKMIQERRKSRPPKD